MKCSKEKSPWAGNVPCGMATFPSLGNAADTMYSCGAHAACGIHSADTITVAAIPLDALRRSRLARQLMVIRQHWR